MRRTRKKRELTSFKCELCGCVFEKFVGRRTYRFCSRKCSSRSTTSFSKTNDALLERWTKKYGIEEAKRRLEKKLAKLSALAIRNNTGRSVSEATRKKISQSLIGVPNVLRGLTFVEFYGEDLAKKLCEQHSQKLRDSYASGRINPTARSKSAPVFRGVKLRSLLEQQAIEFLELTEGLIFGDTLLYEPKETKVTWFDSNGISHTYTPDLYDTLSGTVYEVKPAWRVFHETEEMKRKMQALNDNGFNCRYLTSDDIKS